MLSVSAALEAVNPKRVRLALRGRKTARVWLRGKGSGVKPAFAMVLLPPKEGETKDSPDAGHALGCLSVASARAAFLMSFCWRDNTGNAPLAARATKRKSPEENCASLRGVPCRNPTTLGFIAP
jgi:hypothetical protein